MVFLCSQTPFVLWRCNKRQNPPGWVGNSEEKFSLVAEGSVKTIITSVLTCG